MRRVVYILPDASRQELDIEVGTSVMQAATAHGIEGIVALAGTREHPCLRLLSDPVTLR